MEPDFEIARKAKLKPIQEVASSLGLLEEDLIPYGRFKAKVLLRALEERREKPSGKLIVVSSITPTPLGEGKTTVSIGLGQALARLGKRVMIALREPSIGPCMGAKGGGTGGGYSQVLPPEEINLHFTGDFHAVTTAHNLLAAALDNHIFHGNRLGIDPRQVLWRRVVDMNDRALRQIVVGLGGKMQGVPREDGFLITAASEVMALLCLAEDPRDLKERLGRILVAFRYDGKPVLAKELKVEGAMAALLKDAIHPNLVQTLEGVPAFVHGGPFANIAHGCNSVIATKLALKLADYCVTEAGFGFDLGAEKFFDIKCPYAKLKPDAVVLVTTARALKYHGGAGEKGAGQENIPAIERGMANWEKHIEAVRMFRVPLVVAINRFAQDIDSELKFIRDRCAQLGAEAVVADVWAQGGEGGIALAEKLLEILDRIPSHFAPLYNWNLSVRSKIELIARKMYGAKGVSYTREAGRQIDRFEALGYSKLPICVAKTPRSLSDDPALLGRPLDFTVTVNEVRIAAGAGFLIPIIGEIMTMPGLPRRPSAEQIDLDEEGRIVGLF